MEPPGQDAFTKRRDRLRKPLISAGVCGILSPTVRYLTEPWHWNGPGIAFAMVFALGSAAFAYVIAWFVVRRFG